MIAFNRSKEPIEQTNCFIVDHMQIDLDIALCKGKELMTRLIAELNRLIEQNESKENQWICS